MMKWLRYSGVWITLIVNPFHWDFRGEIIKDEELSRIDTLELQFLCINIRVIIDDGKW
jgi:hypothetical protein